MVGVTGSLEVISKIALFDPLDEGLKATLKAKLLPGAIVLFQLPPVTVNIDASAPLIVEVIIDRLALPLFVTRKEAVLLFLTFTFAKSLAALTTRS